MNEANPYAAPETTAQPMPEEPPRLDIPFSVIYPLSETKPWVLFFSVIGFITTGCTLLYSLFLLMSAARKVPAWMGLFSLSVAALYFVPSLLLYRYAGAIGRFLTLPSFETLATVFVRQRSFWRAATVIGIVLCVVGVWAAYFNAGARRH